MHGNLYICILSNSSMRNMTIYALQILCFKLISPHTKIRFLSCMSFRSKWICKYLLMSFFLKSCYNRVEVIINESSVTIFSTEIPLKQKKCELLLHPCNFQNIWFNLKYQEHFDTSHLQIIKDQYINTWSHQVSNYKFFLLIAML